MVLYILNCTPIEMPYGAPHRQVAPMDMLYGAPHRQVAPMDMLYGAPHRQTPLAPPFDSYYRYIAQQHY